MSKTPRTMLAFDSAYGQLNPAQKRAVDAIEGPVIVIAGPGTGKTTVLTLRIANILLKTDTAPECILALTFTESGAFAMRRKLVEIIGPAAYKVAIHTFHGFAQATIERYPDYFPRVIGSTVIAESDQSRIMEEIIRSRDFTLLRPYGDQTYYIQPVLREIHVLKRENLTPSALRESLERDRAAIESADLTAAEREKARLRNDKNAELATAYERYEKRLAADRYYDFDDMLIELIRTLESKPELKLMLQEQHQYILADEHQDANAAQNRILELLTDFHDSPNLFIVGDDKQAIYRFQGASLENFLYFTTKHPAAVVVDLEHNYRSHQGILDAAHSLIESNPSIPGRSRLRLISLQIGSSPIAVTEYESRDEEVAGVARAVKDQISSGADPDRIAVLYRDNKHADAISTALASLGVAHRVESDRDLLAAYDVAKIELLCRSIADLSRDDLLARALLIPELGCDPAAVAGICREASRTKEPLRTIIAGLTSKDPIRAACALLDRLAREASILQFSDLLHLIIHEIGLMPAILAASDSLERLSAVQAFHEHTASVAGARRDFRLADLVRHLDRVRDQGVGAGRRFTEHVKGVRLMTAHRSKGLEFDSVYIIHATDGVWGNRSSRSLFTIPAVEHARAVGRIEDERRLFYVAMTRARESVSVSYARSDGSRETVPTQFLSEIDQSLVSRLQPPEPDPRQSTPLLNPVGSGVAPSILDAAFVRSAILSQPLAVTHLNNYLECPWKYFFLNLIRMPQAESRHQLYGIAVHAALRSFFDAYSDMRDLSKKQLTDLFAHSLSLQPLSLEDRQDAAAKGTRALGGYYTAWKGTWNRRLLTEYTVRGTSIELGRGERIELVGKLDKVELLDHNMAVVVDYKTGKPKSRNEIEGKTRGADGNYKRQLAFYKLVLDASGKFKMVAGELDFIEPNDRGLYKKERFEITDGEAKEVERLVSAMAKDVLGMSFIAHGCGSAQCEFCRLGDLVRGSRRTAVKKKRAA